MCMYIWLMIYHDFYICKNYEHNSGDHLTDVNTELMPDYKHIMLHRRAADSSSSLMTWGGSFHPKTFREQREQTGCAVLLTVLSLTPYSCTQLCHQRLLLKKSRLTSSIFQCETFKSHIGQRVSHRETSETVSASRQFYTFLRFSYTSAGLGAELMFRCLFQVEHTQSRKHIPSLLQLFSINKMFSSDPVPPSNVRPDTLAGYYN